MKSNKNSKNNKNKFTREQLAAIAKHADIIIASDGTILKGENKLVAISETGIGQKLCIIRNVNKVDYGQVNSLPNTNN